MFLLLISAPGTPGGGLPICDAGADQVVECTGPVTCVQLDATGSLDPGEGNLMFNWKCDDPRATITDPESPTPFLCVEMRGICEFECSVDLRVRNAAGSSFCSVNIKVRDTLNPRIVFCPPNIDVPFGSSTSPDVTGKARARDRCQGKPKVSFQDDTSVPGIIERIWFVSDGQGFDTCSQLIRILPPEFHVDILPGDCPNVIDVTSVGADGQNAEMPVAWLGNDFDPTRAISGTGNIRRPEADTGDPVLVKMERIIDQGTPFLGDLCGCNALGPDGTDDLGLIFDLQEVVNNFQLDQEPDGAEIELEVRVTMIDGTIISGRDCIRISNPN